MLNKNIIRTCYFKRYCLHILQYIFLFLKIDESFKINASLYNNKASTKQTLKATSIFDIIEKIILESSWSK